ncbi:MAG: ATP-binding cassette domain-containing protein [Oenococcus sp.]|uniref:energy-coupling factor ABC transporter ATP-binding protein n=1 Tax=Oenococcus sp. TaxID=1979414 RepID=UPI0039E73B5A
MAIEFQQVNYRYKTLPQEKVFSLEKLSLRINEGDFILVAGSTGSGKTTFLKLLDTLILPSEGQIIFQDQVINHRSPEKALMKIRRLFAFVLQFPQRQLFANTVLEDVAFSSLNFGDSKVVAEKKAAEILERVGLEQALWQRPVFNLSVGQMRKAAIAGSLVNHPQYLLLDEPTAGMDEYAKKDLLELLEQLHKDGSTIIVVSHDLDIFVPFANRMFFFSDGQLLFDQSPAKLYAQENIRGLQLPTAVYYARRLGLKKTPLSLKELAEAINE